MPGAPAPPSGARLGAALDGGQRRRGARGYVMVSPLGVDAGPGRGGGVCGQKGAGGRLSLCAPGPLPMSRPRPLLSGPVPSALPAPTVRTQPGVPLVRPVPLTLSFPPQPSTQTRWRLLFLASAESSLQDSGSSGGRK